MLLVGYRPVGCTEQSKNSSVWHKAIRPWPWMGTDAHIMFGSKSFAGLDLFGNGPITHHNPAQICWLAQNIVFSVAIIVPEDSCQGNNDHSNWMDNSGLLVTTQARGSPDPRAPGQARPLAPSQALAALLSFPASQCATQLFAAVRVTAPIPPWIIFFLPTSRKDLPTFQTFCPVRVHFTQTVVHFAHFHV